MSRRNRVKVLTPTILPRSAMRHKLEEGILDPQIHRQHRMVQALERPTRGPPRKKEKTSRKGHFTNAARRVREAA